MKAFEYLRERSLRFLVEAEEDLRRGFYDLAAFHAEQAVQLYLKSMILRLSGEERRGHEIRELMAEIAFSLDVEGLNEISRELKELAKRYRREIKELEEAYYEARYKPIAYTKEEAEEAVSAARLIISKLREIEERLWPSP